MSGAAKESHPPIRPTGNRIPFKSCSCGDKWTTRESFVRDAGIYPIGMMLEGKQNVPGYYFFNHAGCQSTLTIDVQEFADLIKEPIPPLSMAETDECPRNCRRMEDLDSCNVECRHAPFRRLLIDRIIRKNI